MKMNTIYCGDNLEWLKKFQSRTFDFCYIDPPFNTGNNYDFNDDRGSVKDYLKWISPRLKEIYRVLNPVGIFCMHTDYRTSHYLRVYLDKIYGYKRFLNEIIWYRNIGASRNKNKVPNKHDNILVYSKNEIYPFNPVRGKITKSMKDRYRYQDEKGRYMISGGKKYYLKGGKQKNSVIEINMSPVDNQRTGYSTQKPEELLEFLLKSFTSQKKNKDDIKILDAFAGSGTTNIVAHDMGFKWVAIDNNSEACKIIKNRFNEKFSISPKIIREEEESG